MGCFGKLPIHGDFIRHNVSTRGAVELDEWVREGYAGVVRMRATGRYRQNVDQDAGQSMGQNVADNDEAETTAPAYHFVFASGTTEKANTIGTVVMSRDSSGRSYPFVVYKVVHDTQLGETPASMPAVYQDFFAGADVLCLANWQRESLATLTGRVDALSDGDAERLPRSRLLLAEVEALKQVGVGELWRCIGSDADQKFRARVFQTVRELLEEVARRSPDQIDWGLRLPLPPEAFPIGHIVFWVHAADRILAEHGWRAHYFWWQSPDGNAPAELTLFFRPVSASYFAHLVGAGSREDLIVDPFQAMQRLHTPSPAALELARLSEQCHLADALDQWSQWRATR